MNTAIQLPSIDDRGKFLPADLRSSASRPDPAQTQPVKIRPEAKVQSSHLAARKKSIQNQIISKRETTIKQEQSDSISTNIVIRNISTEAQAKRSVIQAKNVASNQTFGAPSDSITVQSPIASEKHVDAVKSTPAQQRPMIREEDGQEQPVMETVKIKRTKTKKINGKRNSVEPPLTANPGKKKRSKLKHKVASDAEDVQPATGKTDMGHDALSIGQES